MKYLFLSTALGSLISFGIAAQAAQIRIIKEDGSEQVYDIPQGQGSPTPVPENRQPRIIEVPRPEKPLAQPQAAPVETPPSVERAAPKKPAQRTVKPAQKSKPPVSEGPAKPESMGRVVKPVQNFENADILENSGQPISERQATRIALEIAPPSRGYNVLKRTYDDKLIYVIRFRTERGQHDILVDALTGKILQQ